MDFKILQDGFGTDPAKLYSFEGEIPDDSNPVEYITHQFVEDAGTNLIACVVSQFNGSWMVYTKDNFELGENFRLLTEFPLPEPEEPAEETPEEPAPEGGPQ